MITRSDVHGGCGQARHSCDMLWATLRQVLGMIKNILPMDDHLNAFSL